MKTEKEIKERLRTTTAFLKDRNAVNAYLQTHSKEALAEIWGEHKTLEWVLGYYDKIKNPVELRGN